MFKFFMSSQHCSFLWPIFRSFGIPHLTFLYFFPSNCSCVEIPFSWGSSQFLYYSFLCNGKIFLETFLFIFHFCARQGHVLSSPHLPCLTLYLSTSSSKGKTSHIPGHPRSLCFLCFSEPPLFRPCKNIILHYNFWAQFSLGDWISLDIPCLIINLCNCFKEINMIFIFLWFHFRYILSYLQCMQRFWLGKPFI